MDKLTKSIVVDTKGIGNVWTANLAFQSQIDMSEFYKLPQEERVHCSKDIIRRLKEAIIKEIMKKSISYIDEHSQKSVDGLKRLHQSLFAPKTHQLIIIHPSNLGEFMREET